MIQVDILQIQKNVQRDIAHTHTRRWGGGGGGGGVLIICRFEEMSF